MITTLIITGLAALAYAHPVAKRSGFSTFDTTITALLTSSTEPISLAASDVVDLALPTTANFAAAAYCSTIALKDFNCGISCSSSDAQVLAVGGDSVFVPRFYVAFSKSNSAIVVAHAGTNTSSILQVGADLSFTPVPADPDLTIGGEASGAPGVHSGFQILWQQSKSQILSAVQDALAGPAREATSILVTGHSLGASVALLNALFLHNQNLGIPVTTTLFALPRTGNNDFAKLVNERLGNNQVHIVNANDIVPHLPPDEFGFQHPSNEIWQVSDSADVRLCGGGEDQACSNSLDVLELSAEPHGGPYFGVNMGLGSCGQNSAVTPTVSAAFVQATAVAGDSIASITDDAIDGISSAAQKAISTIKSAADKVADTVKKGVKSVLGNIGNLFG